MHPFRLAIRSLGAAALAALIATSLPTLTGTARAATGAAPVATNAIDPHNIDPTCKACDDFYQYADGGWLKSNTIPPGHASWGGFDELAQHNREALHAILDDAAKETSAPAGSDTQKIGTFYRACMDEAAIEKAGLAPIDPLLRDIGAVSNEPALAVELAKLQAAGVGDGLDFGSEPDTKDSSKTIASIGIGGLGLPDRDYYLKTDERTTKIVAAYREYVATQLRNLGDAPAQAASEAGEIVALETAIAKVTPTRVELRDPKATYHPMTVAALATIGPHVPWQRFFAQFGAPGFDSLDVNVPGYVTGYDAQLAATPLAAWKTYLRFHVVDAFANALPKRFADAGFAFHSGVLYGVKEQLPRWQRCTSATDAALRTPLGKAYVAVDFPPAAKTRAQEMVDNLQATLRGDIGRLDWMSPPTKAYAIKKLDAFTKKIGYPNTWEDYSSLTIADVPYAELIERVRAWNHGVDMARIGKPTDRTLWGMTPPTVNAYYNPTNNEIVFPAGILQPPFFFSSADDAVNYGAIGAVIGHEMTHGFDDQGRLYDASGNLTDWWTPADAANFGKRAQCIVDEYDSLEALPGVHMNGKLVEGEAIADLGGTTIAFKAFERTPEYKAGRSIGGFTPAQRFFLAYAQVWRGLQNEAYTRQLAQIDPHANDKLRVNGTLSNMPEFAAAWKCAAADKMVRKDRCQIW